MGSLKISRRNPGSPFFSVSYSINRNCRLLNLDVLGRVSPRRSNRGSADPDQI